MPTKVYKKGDPFPEFSKDVTVRLYNMKFCPYAQRARLALEAKGVKHELIYMHIGKNLPEWFLARNPNGQVPALEYPDGRTLYESAVVSQYVDDTFPGEKLTPSDPFIKAKHSILLTEFSKVTNAYYAIFLGKSDKTKETWEKLEKALELYERELSGKYFGGDKAALIDFQLWPHFERFPLFKSLNKMGFELSTDKFPKLIGWLRTMKEHPAVKATIVSDEEHLAFVETVQAGNAAYGLGLE